MSITLFRLYALVLEVNIFSPVFYSCCILCFFLFCFDAYMPNIYVSEIHAHVLCIVCLYNGLDQYFKLIITHLYNRREI
jgi:hypothetical protein